MPVNLPAMPVHLPTTPESPDPSQTPSLTQTTGQEVVRWFDWLLGAPLQIVVTIVASFILLAILRWAIGRTVRSLVEGGTSMRRHTSRFLQRTPVGGVVPSANPLAVARRVQRAETMGSVLRSAAALVVGIIAITVIANIMDWDLGPVLASAGVVGVALGFGAQTLVKDFLAGIFLLVEDQYGVGDVVDLGEAVGTVEAIGLRVTQVRDLSGTLWHVRNGEVLRVGNMTQGWSNAFLEVLVPPEQDLALATELLRDAAAATAQDPEVSGYVLDEPSITAYDSLSAESVTLRLSIKVAPAQQWAVQRVARARIRDAFSERGVALAVPRREVVVERERPRDEGAADRSG